jgi:pyruvate dehydrogenase E1 component beta subunit
VKRLTDDGISVELIDLRTLTPLDVDAVLDSVRKTSRAVLVSEAPRTAGFMSEVSAIISERAMFSLTAPVRRVTGWDTVFPLKRSESLYLPSTDRIVSAVRSTLEASV